MGAAFLTLLSSGAWRTLGPKTTLRQYLGSQTDSGGYQRKSGPLVCELSRPSSLVLFPFGPIIHFALSGGILAQLATHRKDEALVVV